MVYFKYLILNPNYFSQLINPQMMHGMQLMK